MKAHFFDLEDDANHLNGSGIESSAQLWNILESLHESLHNRQPFIAELIGDNGFKLMFGLGTEEGFVQFSSVEDDPPYLLAVNPDLGNSEGECEFLCGGTLTSIEKRYCLPYDAFLEILVEFVKTGQRKPDVQWEELRPPRENDFYGE
jgi:hypothetical protein